MTQRTFGQHPPTPLKLLTVINGKFVTIWDEGQRGAANDALGTVNQFLKEIFIIMNLNLSNGRGQTNDGASNMMGRNLEFRLKFLCSSQKLLPYTVKDISSANQ